MSTISSHHSDRPEEERALQYFFSNKMGRIVYLAMEEVMGSSGLSTILNLARLQERVDGYPPNNFENGFSFDELGRLMQALEEMYGPRKGSGLARQIGRTCFKLGIRDLGAVLGITDVAFQIFPLRMKMKIGLEVLAHMFDRFSDHLVRLEESEERFQWIIERCGVCWGRDCEAPCCHLAVGVLEEELYWISGGLTFPVEETSCIAAGDPACTILIGKQPLE